MPKFRRLIASALNSGFYPAKYFWSLDFANYIAHDDVDNPFPQSKESYRDKGLRRGNMDTMIATAVFHIDMHEFERATELLNQAAARGSANAVFWLADIQTGLNNYAAALGIYRKAADLGSRSAYNTLSMSYKHGERVCKDVREGRRLGLLGTIRYYDRTENADQGQIPFIIY
jgi:TPR repeat protein